MANKYKVGDRVIFTHDTIIQHGLNNKIGQIISHSVTSKLFIVKFNNGASMPCYERELKHALSPIGILEDILW